MDGPLSQSTKSPELLLALAESAQFLPSPEPTLSSTRTPIKCTIAMRHRSTSMPKTTAEIDDDAHRSLMRLLSVKRTSKQSTTRPWSFANPVKAKTGELTRVSLTAALPDLTKPGTRQRPVLKSTLR